MSRYSLKQIYTHKYTWFGLMTAIICALFLSAIIGASGFFAGCIGAFFGFIMQHIANNAIIEDIGQ